MVIETSEAVLLSLAASSAQQQDFMSNISIECEINTTDSVLKPVVGLIPDPATKTRARDKLFG